MASLCFILMLWLPALAFAYEAPTPDQISEIKDAIDDWLADNSGLHPTVVRLAFHDCVGGCDGCINLDNASNAGLENAITSLEDLYATYSTMMSRADFWQLAAIVALDRSVFISNRQCSEDGCKMPSLNLVFRWGRDDCETSPYTTDTQTFPEANVERAEMMSYFDQEFGYTEDEVVALMGAHSLGRCSRNASGYAGVWTSRKRLLFNNQLYQMMVDSSYSFENQAKARRSPTDKKWQFKVTDEVGDSVGILLNTDLEVAYDIDYNNNDGTTCGVMTTCPHASTYGLVETFAADTTAFAEAFASIYQKLIETGYDDLQEV